MKCAMWLMTTKRLTLARLAGEYGLKTADADEAAKKLGLNLRRGDATVLPWQEKRLRPALKALQNRKEARRHHRAFHERAAAGPVAYEAGDDNTGFIDEAPRLGFSNAEWARQLSPVLKEMQEDSG
jgi:hypothetical protein